ncbi:CLUMA_CG010895, isoform A [Clunio marinus]|uniref:CLUMA_CG010895, isoform A n=1 Tax=Clunio marinus TaxID=568069 RepID=A0A1J1ICM4_9DIPT|nr:CLUMA_CG010895, isoform A [Clunio marinus]
MKRLPSDVGLLSSKAIYIHYFPYSFVIFGNESSKILSEMTQYLHSSNATMSSFNMKHYSHIFGCHVKLFNPNIVFLLDYETSGFLPNIKLINVFDMFERRRCEA